MRTLLVGLKWIIVVFRFIIPFTIRVFRMALNMTSAALASIWVGVPTAVTRIANQWVGLGREFGIPEKYDGLIFYPVCVVATIALFLGWLVMAYITVLIVQLTIIK